VLSTTNEKKQSTATKPAKTPENNSHKSSGKAARNSQNLTAN
jgi:hypothetical protein